LQTFIKAIQNEFVLVITESDISLLQIVSKEFLKAVKFILSKIEGLLCFVIYLIIFLFLKNIFFYLFVF
jgi:hypothetical protein